MDNRISLKDAPESLRDDRDLVMMYVKRDGLNLQYASERLRDDYEIVRAAVDRNYRALMYACEDYQYDYDLVMMGHSCSIKPKHIKKEILRNRDFMEKICDPHLLRHCSKIINNNRDGSPLKFVRCSPGKSILSIWDIPACE